MYDSVSYSFLTNFGENIINSDAVWTVPVPFGVVTVSVLLYSALADFYSLLLKSWNLQRKEVHDGRQTRMSLNKSRSYLLYSLICICMLPEKSTKMIMLCHFCLLLCVLSCFCIVSCSVFPPEFLHTCSASPSQLLPCTLGLLPLTCASTLFSTCTPSPPQLSLYLSPLFCSVYVKSSLVFAVPALVLIKMSSIDLPARFLLHLDSASDLSSTKMFYLTTLKEVRHKECGLFCLFLRNLLNWRGSIQMVLKQSKPQLLICFFS